MSHNIQVDKRIIQSQYSVALETITPEKAKQYLTRAVFTRNLNPQRVKQYAADMKAGHWRITNQGIGFTSEGNLIDGQHRMHAIILSNTPIEMLVARGISSDALGCLDVGQGRTAGQTLSHHNVANANNVASTLTMVHRFLHQDKSRLSPNAYLDMLREYPEAIEVNEGISKPQRVVLRTPIRAAIVFAWKANPEKVREFLETLSSGADLSEDDPRYQLREYSIGFNSNPSAGLSNEAPRNSMFRKTLNAIKMFLDKKKATGHLQDNANAVKYFFKVHGIDTVDTTVALTQRQRTRSKNKRSLRV